VHGFGMYRLHFDVQGSEKYNESIMEIVDDGILVDNFLSQQYIKQYNGKSLLSGALSSQ
jgi:hypothetical protein